MQTLALKNKTLCVVTGITTETEKKELVVSTKIIIPQRGIELFENYPQPDKIAYVVAKDDNIEEIFYLLTQCERYQIIKWLLILGNQTDINELNKKIRLELQMKQSIICHLYNKNEFGTTQKSISSIFTNITTRDNILNFKIPNRATVS